MSAQGAAPAKAWSTRSSSLYSKQQLSDQVKSGAEPVRACPAQQCDSVDQQEITRSCTPVPATQEHFQQHPFDENGADGHCPTANTASGGRTEPHTGALSPCTPKIWSPSVGAQDCSAMTGHGGSLSTSEVGAWANVTTPPGAPSRGKPFVAALFRALRHGSFEDVQTALEFEPDAAFLPMFECNTEPPLCYSVRLGCSEKIIQLLLQHGACVDVEDGRGQTPLMLLSSMPSNLPPAVFEFTSDAGNSRRLWSLSVAKLLMDAEADSMSSHRHLLSCIDLASQAGNTHLVRLYRGQFGVAAQDNEEELLVMSAMSHMLPWTISEPPAMSIMSS
eukprot:TRINITY_DN477_c0_g1_i1.p1 TRINITY_DN477_c0_g1~~TRINITY_DN477_c0_g1_i1.p1  ORF type:complete len:333 (+),score=58.16 TRINITY_DN477_c0_g1_i1:190-1188(+)